MHFSLFVNQLLGMLYYLIPIIILITILKSSWFKGVVGEFVVNILAKLMLDKNDYHLIKNVTLPTLDGTTQIDHIIVSKYGVFVIETKNMKGWIFGSTNQKIWTQKIFKHSSKFQNPLHQNYKHVKTLAALLTLNDSQIHSLIVFIGDATFKTEMPENVTYGSDYIRFIKSKRSPVLSTTDVNKVIHKIESGRLARSFRTNREHLKHVTKIVTEKTRDTPCPKCGSSMVMRETKKGDNQGKKFWGCRNFPKCRGIINIAQVF